MRFGMLVPSVGENDDRAQVGGTSPEFAEHVALNADVLHPFVVDDFVVVVGAAPSTQTVGDGGILFYRGILKLQRELYDLGILRVVMNLLRLAEKIAGLGLPVLALALVWRQLQGAAVP